MRARWAAVLTVLALAVVGSASAGPPAGRYLLPTRALWVDFEKPGSPRGYYTGELLELLGPVGVSNEVSRQLDHMRTLGVNEVELEMRSAGGDTPPPWDKCDLSTLLGPTYPQPTETQLNGLRTVLALIQRHGMRAMLILNNTHMDEQPPVRSQQWLAAILGAVKDSPALDVISFGGDRQIVDALPPYDGVPDSCGGQAEAPLWLGPDSLEARYVQWAIGYGISRGIPPQKLTAEAIVGDYRHEVEQPAGPAAQDRHLWRPLEVLRTVFDRLGVPAAQRTYAVSYYEHSKCSFVEFGACADESEGDWTAETLRVSKSRVGPESRLLVAEWGVQNAEPAIPRAVEQYGAILLQLGIEGGAYWKWSDSAAADGRYATNPAVLVKVRGPGYRYQPVANELADLYGFHLAEVPNGSFEDGVADWSVKGSAEPLPRDEPAPWRGATFLRVDGTIVSRAIPVTPRTSYTTSARLRGPAATLVIRFGACKGKAPRPATFRFAGSSGLFAAFPVTYTTPQNACFVRVEISSVQPLDVDAVR